jgi:hypothetical protein
LMIAFYVMPVTYEFALGQQHRIEDRIRIGNITIKYDANRWRLVRYSSDVVEFSCDGQKCDASVWAHLENNESICNDRSVSLLALEKSAVLPRKFSGTPKLIAERQVGKLKFLFVSMYSGCHVGRSDYVFACAPYRDQTLTAWIMPRSCSSGPSKELLSALLSGIITR